MDVKYFNCKKLHAFKLSISTCLARQRENVYGISHPFIECIGCKQGEELFQKYGAEDVRKDHMMEEEKTEIIASEKRLCVECGGKPTISKNSPYCASCMARRANSKRKTAVLQDNKHDSGKDKTDSLKITLDFTDHRQSLEEILALAKSELRSIENQMIYMLKNQTAKSGMFPHLPNP
jgi:hypothetical protein